MASADVALTTLVDFLGDSYTIGQIIDIEESVERLRQSSVWKTELKNSQKRAINRASANRREIATIYQLEQNNCQSYIDELGIEFDFIASAMSWCEAITNKENLSLQQQLYMSAFGAVANEQLNALLVLRENVHANGNLPEAEAKYIDAAIAAMICDICATRDSHMNAAARAEWNASLSNTKSLTNALWSTGEFVISLMGVDDLVL